MGNVIEYTDEFIDNLKYQWTGEVQLENGQIITIWWTAWSMLRGRIKRVINVYSDFPKAKIKQYC